MIGASTTNSNQYNIPETKLAVTSVQLFSESRFGLALERGDLVFEPGDCLSLNEDTGETSRTYSIAFETQEDELRFLIRRIPAGRVSDYLSRLRPGDAVCVSEPFVWFRPWQTGKEPFVFIATGTGMAPVLSCLRSFPHRSPLRCLWGVRKLADAVYAETLAEVCTLSLAVSREDAAPHLCCRVTGLLNDLPEADWLHYFLCGSEAMITETKGILERQGCPITKNHREVFFYDRSVD